MELGTIYESASELKNLLHHRSDLTALEQNLSSLLRQLYSALQVEDAADPEFNRLAGVVFKFFEGSQSASGDFMKLWEITAKINSDSPAALILVRTFSLLIRVLCRRPTFLPYASKLTKDCYTQQVKYINRFLSANNGPSVVCGLDLLGAMASVDTSCAEFLFENIDFSMRAFNNFATNRRKVLIDPITRVESERRVAFIEFMSALLSYGSYDVKAACLKVHHFINPIVAGLFHDSPERVLSFLKTVDSAILSNSQNSKTLAVSFLTPGNMANFVKLLEYENPIIQKSILDILTKLASSQSPSNVIFKVDKLSADESSSLRNKVLLNAVNNLKIFDSVDQLQISLNILEECPDVVGPYLKTVKFSFEPEISIKWLTLCSYMAKICDLRPSETVEIDKSTSLEHLFSAQCPPRATLTRVLLFDSALVKLYSFQLLLSVLKRIFWCLEITEKDIQACLSAALELSEMNKRLEMLKASRLATISAAENLVPDIQTLQSLLNLLLSDKEIRSNQDELEVQLLPQGWRNELITLCLDSLKFYLRIFVSQEDSLGQAQFEDPMKFLSPLFATKEVSLASSLEYPILQFVSVFPRIIINASSVESFENFFSFICSMMNENNSDKANARLAEKIFGCILYSTGLFISCPDEIQSIASCISSMSNFSKLASLIIKDILYFRNSTENLVYERQIVRGGVEVSALMSKWLKLEISDELFGFAQSVLDRNEKIQKEDKLNQVKRAKIEYEDKNDSIKVDESSESDSDSISDSDSSNSDSSDSESESESDDEFELKRKLKVLDNRVNFELPDPEATEPSVMFSQLLSQIDRNRMHQFILNFPTSRKLVPPSQRRRVNDNMLKDLLYGSEDFLLFCNWLGVLSHFVQVVPRDQFDGYGMTRSNLLGALVMGLSSEDASMRRVCNHLLSAVHDAIRPISSTSSPSPHERIRQVYSLLGQLRRSISYDDSSNVSSPSGFVKISSVTALYYAEAVSIMIRPDHFMYGIIGGPIYSNAFQKKFYGVPLFDDLIRRADEHDNTNNRNSAALLERPDFIRNLQWILKIIQYGCKSRADLERDGALYRSRVLETILSLLSLFTASIGKNKESERAASSVIRLLRHLKSIDGEIAEFLEKEFGHSKWLEMLRDSVIKARNPQNRSRLNHIEDLLN